MPTPEFITRLRDRIGHDPLWLVGSTAVVIDGDRLLLVRRADDGTWTPPGGIVEPGEHSADAAEREVLEEANVIAKVEKLAAVSVSREYLYSNGDRTQFTTFTYRLRYVSGTAAVGDDESVAAQWFRLDALPSMHDDYERRIRWALDPRPDTLLVRDAEG